MDGSMDGYIECEVGLQPPEHYVITGAIRTTRSLKAAVVPSLGGTSTCVHGYNRLGLVRVRVRVRVTRFGVWGSHCAALPHVVLKQNPEQERHSLLYLNTNVIFFRRGDFENIARDWLINERL